MHCPKHPCICLDNLNNSCSRSENDKDIVNLFTIQSTCSIALLDEYKEILLRAFYTGWAKKTRPLRLTAYIFKTTETIYMIFGTIQHSAVLNTSVTSILNKVIMRVVPTSEKV